MSEYRAILVSLDERDDPMGWALGTTADVICERWDAAGVQPRIRWCAEHEQYATRWAKTGSEPPWYACGQANSIERAECDCRVVDAIVVPLPEQP